MKPFLSRCVVFLFVSISNCGYSQGTLNQGLIGYWPFEGNANDASGNGINATSINATLTTDRSGQANKAYYFDGVSSFIQLPFSALYDFAPEGKFSISLWVTPYETSNIYQAMVVKSPLAATPQLSMWNYGVYLDENRAMTGWAGNNFLVSTTTLLSTSCWGNIIVTYDNGIWQMFINGKLEAYDYSKTRFIVKDGSSPIAFGRKGLTPGDWFKGKLDDIRIYNRVLNSDEILALSFQENQCSTLPVVFKDFQANVSSNNVASVKCQVLNGLGIQNIFLERGVNSMDFKEIGKMKRNDGSASFIYADDLKMMQENIFFYRLRFQNKNGAQEYSSILLVKKGASSIGHIFIPGSISRGNALTVQIQSRNAQAAALRMINESGVVIYQKSVILNSGSNTIMVSELPNMPTGLYHISVATATDVYSKKLIIE